MAYTKSLAQSIIYSIIFLTCSVGASASDAEPPLCPIDEFESGVMLLNEDKSSKTFNGDKPEIILKPGNENVAYRVRIRAIRSAGEPDWTVNLNPLSENACAEQSSFSATSAEFSENWSTLLSPEYCGGVRVSATLEIGDKKSVEGLELYLDIFEGARRSRQLSVIDKDPNASPNWCRVSEFKGGIAQSEGLSPADGFMFESEALHINFLNALDSVVLVGMTYAKDPYANNIRSSSNDQYLTSCTGFYIADDLVMTNRHCVCPASRPEKNDSLCSGYEGLIFDGLEGFESISGKDSKLVAFDWRIWSRTDTKGGNAPSSQSAKVVALGKSARDRRPELEGRKPLDYAILQAPSNENAKPVKLERTVATRKDELSLLQYPGNQDLVVNYDTSCQVVYEVGAEKDDFEGIDHGCDSAGGSSGSPLFDRSMGTVVGVHFCCGNKKAEERLQFNLKNGNVTKSDEFPEKQDKWNRAASISSILDDLEIEYPALYTKIISVRGIKQDESGDKDQ